ncbi:MAG: GNAT family N-acetyltransferase, partial [Bryobacteraceae bacterium]
MTLLSTSRLLLRRWRAEDREPFYGINSDPRVMEYFPACLTRAESDAAIDRMEAHFEQHGFGLWAAEVLATGELAGFIGLSRPQFTAHFTPCVEIGWRLGTRFWGRGLATEGAREIMRFGFEQARLSEIVSFTVARNLRSIRVMEKLGMRRDPADDFDHPLIAAGHPLRRHVLYRLRAVEYQDWLRHQADQQ